MIALASSPGLFIVLACLLGLFVVLWCFTRRPTTHVAVEPEDLSANLADTFIIKPYVQLGNYPRQGSTEQLELLWHAKSAHSWAVQARVYGESSWRAPVAVTAQTLTIAALGETERCLVTLHRLPAGVEVEYRVLCDGAIAFASRVRTRNGRNQPYRFAVAGDLGAPVEGHEQRIAHQIHLRSPHLLVVPGDIVYDRGRVSEYMRNFFPVYNSDDASPANGAPILRSTLVVGVAGNHDVAMPKAMVPRNFTRFPDLLGYYLFFSQPLNGPGIAGGANTPRCEGDPEAIKVFTDAAGMRYPVMASFSFQWGNAFWLVLDSNAYMDWTDATIRNWVDAQLASASDATWRFVTFHHPSFSSDGKHSNEQRMRLLAPIFEKYGVDVVFAGHMHCYERSHPLRFTPDKLETELDTEECPVTGALSIDTEYDGAHFCKPKGIIYLTSGAAGAKFHRDSDPGKAGLKPFTVLYDQKVHSFTICDVDGKRLAFTQITEDGTQIDRFVIEK